MFTELVEYEVTLEKIATKTHLNENQTNTLINLIKENPTITPTALFDAAVAISNGEKYLFNGGVSYSLEPILMESTSVNLMEISIPVITKYIPESVIKHFTDKHARAIVEGILKVEFNPETDTALDLRKRIDEMFDAGDISIPVQGLRKEPNSVEIIMNGVFAPMLYKGIQFDKKFYNKPKKSHCDNRTTLKQALKDYSFTNDETPLMKLLPKFIITLKNLLGND